MSALTEGAATTVFRLTGLPVAAHRGQVALLHWWQTEVVRGFVILTVSVLIVIGAGVGVLSATTPYVTAMSCNSTGACFDTTSAWTGRGPFLAPSDPRLSVTSGLVDMTTPPDWTVGVNYRLPGAPWIINWTVTALPKASFRARCPSTPKVVAYWVRESGRRFCVFGNGGVVFQAYDALYVAFVEAPFGYSASQEDRVLLGEIRRLHLVS